MRKTIRTLWKAGLLATGLLALPSGDAVAQTTIATTYAFTSSQAAVTFVVDNPTATPIIVTGVSSALLANAASTINLWTSTTSLSGTPTVATPVWTNVATLGPVSVPANGTYTLFSALNITIPSGGQTRFCVQASGSVLYSNVVTNTNAFTSPGGVILRTGSSTIGGLNVGYGGAMPTLTLTPRFFVGSITYSLPCTSPPTAGTTVSGPNAGCLGLSSTLSLSGGTSGIGQTYQWLLNGSPIGGATSSTYAAPYGGPASYSCTVTCGGLSSTSVPLALSTNTTTFPEDFSSTTFPPNCISQTGLSTLLLRSTANGFAAAGTGSGLWNFFNAAAATTLTLTSPVFTPFGTPKQVAFDVAGAAYTGGEIDQVIVEASTDGGATWPITLATLNNNPTNGALNPTHLATTTAYVPAAAGEWATLSYVFNGTVNRIRWRGVSAFGNRVYIDNLRIIPPPACTSPTAVTTSNPTTTGADVSWTCAGCTGSYFVEYGPPGFIPGTGAAAGAGTVVGPIATTSTTLSGLSAASLYDVYVRQECTAGVIYSTNSEVVTLSTSCAGASCAYAFHLTDNFGDGWNGALVEVQVNGFTVATLGPQVTTCEAFVNVNICEGASLQLVCTNAGDFPDEVGLSMTDPFGAVLFQTRGTTLYAGNCAITYPTPGTLEDITTGTKYAGTGNCTPPPCTDPPVAGTISATSSSLCSGTGTTLTMSNGLSTGLTRQWQQSATGAIGTWSNIGGANAQTYATGNLTASNYYRFYLDCGAGSDTSAAFLVNVSLAACFCTASHSQGCGFGNITNVTFNTLNNSTVCNPPGYEAFAPTGTATTTVQRAVSYPLKVTTDQSCIISVWADWNHNLVYETTEWTQVALSSTANVASTISLQVPLTAQLGATAIRIRSRFSGNTNGAANACGTFGSGESEDYVIDVTPEPACIPASAITFANVNNDGFDVNWTNGVNSCGLAVYNIEYGPVGFVQGTGTTVGPFANGPATLTGLDPLTRYDVYVTRDCNPCGDGVGSSSLGTVTTYPDCALAQPINCPSGVGFFGANAPGAWNFVEPLFGFTTVGTEQIFSLSASVLGSYSMSLTANAGNSIVAIYIKDQALGCGPDNWTYVGTNQYTVQNFAFPITATGNYYVLVDPVSSSLDISTYIVTFVCPVQNIDCSTAQPLACGAQVQSSTTGLTNSLPPSACAFAEAPSTGGSVWYSYTNTVAQEVTASTCGTAQFDTRISIFQAAPDCSNLICVAQNDDGTGCPNFSSEVSFTAAANVVYYIVVHGYGASEGIFAMNVFCAAPCAPAIANDACGTATTLIPALDDGSGVPTPGDNTCAHADQFTSCDGFGALQGMWYSFNSGPNALMFMDLALGTAGTMNYALYNGGCSGLGATGEVDCVIAGDGLGTQLPPLTPSTNYLLYLWNDGGVGQEGDFSVLLRAPALNDAAVDAIPEPSLSLCSTTIDPQIVIRNNGELNLTSAVITYDIDGGTPLVFNWVGDLAYQQTETVTLPTISSPSVGLHTLHVSSSLPNGVADGLTSNDAASKQVNITGETVVVAILTDNNPGQITWAITNSLGETVATGGPTASQNNQQVNTNVCLATTQGNCFNFYLFDGGGDGLLGAGNWELRNAQGRSVMRDDGQYTSTSPVSPPSYALYGDNHPFCLPLGPTSPLSSECGIYNNLLNNKVFCNTVPGATNYQFEFRDANAGWIRRITVARNYVQFGELSSAPLVNGRTYFCRVRVDQGTPGFDANDRFGAGCDMALDAVQPACTELISTPGSTFSCGASKRFGSSDKVYAIPVPFATQYRFRFNGLVDIDGPNPNLATDTLGVDNFNDPPVLGWRNITKTTYVCPLSWVTWQLVRGQTYQVQVEVFVAGQWKGLCGASCPLTILLNPANGNNDRMQEEEVEMPVITTELFPNPVNDGLVNLQLAGLTDADHQIGVEVFDLFGKRVMAEQFNASGELFTTTMELDASMSAGIYMVNITVDGVTTTKRLSVL